ncbi:E3 ubiquitin-protein ligase HOS1 [Quillaja saponaria]|uniref:E3 ubiquitin-protein ligase HOS1 n=1 Tax=Quillaja saponaria TaxID=32244 RepID=A0AAD7KRG5_QUISA|nr:E3 ubiquitin-protein ligase HOS1 [Quillaja saponaria]
MDRRLNGPTIASSSAAGGGVARSSYPALQPNYSSRAVQEALEHLASIDLIDLCKEAKVECCRATRDLRSCGRYVHHVLNTCGHASLCAECSQRCEICPICRIPIANSGTRLRLFYECIEAGLISKRCDERFQEKEDGERLLNTDVQRLYSLFDVALENNLVSLICHYVIDICMDESAVSSDPIIAFLLDEVVVKDWCKGTFENILTELQGIYNLNVEGLKSRLSLLLKFIVYVAGISNVLEVLESSFKGTLSAHLQDLHHLQERILKTKQHLEIMIWCIRHQFLDNVRSCHMDSTSWASAVRERRSAAVKRAWPDAVNNSEESTKWNGSLFIEDALANLDMDQGFTHEMGEEIDIASLCKDGVKGMAVCYPFETVRAAADVLFLHGSSDLVIAKQAIFLYYLFDRHWTIPDEEWRDIVEDFAATFSITRHSILESLIFYLLDCNTDEALQEACRLLPEISGPATHPKIAEVLLERDSPDTALMVLRWSGRDGGAQMISIREAVTAVRVRVECGLLTEAFMHQRMLCTRVREKKLNYRPSGNATANLKGECSSWTEWVEILVTEICCLCIRRKLVDRMIALPWNSDEEKYIHTCLLDYAVEDPLRTTGNLLVVFYIQRHRYADAYPVHLKLQTMDQDYISENSVHEELLSRMTSTSHWRANLVDRCLELLPGVERQQLRSGKLPEAAVTSQEVEIPSKSDLPVIQDPKPTSLLIPSSGNSSHVLHTDHTTGFLRPSVSETATGVGEPVSSFGSEFSNFGSSSFLHERLFSNTDGGPKLHGGIGKSFRYDNAMHTKTHQTKFLSASPLKGMNRISSSYPRENLFDKLSPEVEQNGFLGQNQNTSPLTSYKGTAKRSTRYTNNHEFSRDSAHDLSPSSKIVQSDRDDRPWNMVPSYDSMDVSLSHVEKGLTVEDRKINGGPRWRSDEASDEEEEHGIERALGIASHATPTRAFRRSRLSNR